LQHHAQRQQSLFGELESDAERIGPEPSLARQLTQRLELEKLSGVRHVALAQTPEARLHEICSQVEACRKCNLWKTRLHVVPGQGDPRADLLFVGEAPGAEEDRQGLAFVGRAGQMLTRIIQSINLERDQVFIGNILKCRPPANRTPLPDEIAQCLPYLLAQLQVINPTIVCALGGVAANVLLGGNEPISRLRGNFIPYGSAKLIATYHPAYLLRNPAEKRKVWADIQKVRDELLRQRSVVGTQQPMHKSVRRPRTSTGGL